MRWHDGPGSVAALGALSDCPEDTIAAWLRAVDRERTAVFVEPFETFGEGRHGLCVRSYFADGTRGWLFSLRDFAPYEALEALVARGLAPDDDAPRWYVDTWLCDDCHKELHGDSSPDCTGCFDANAVPGAPSPAHVPTPPPLPLVVSVAALGLPRWLRAEELARVVCPGAAVAWRAMRRADFDEAVARHHPFGSALDSVPKMAAIALEHALGGRGWGRGERPLGAPGRHPGPPGAWRAICDLARMGCGVVGLSDRRVTLGVCHAGEP